MATQRRGFERMKQPSLLEDLKAVLDQYPDNGQILKELIQNADDARASLVRMVYDGREFPAHRPDMETNLDKPCLLTMQGPALCVYNDGLFEERDWDGIKRLRSSVKAEDKLKVGRFGLGFKSIFHMTDHVAILSGDRMLFINPFRVGEECCTIYLDAMTEEEEGLVLRALGGLGGLLGGVPELLRERRPFPGTVFWLPLRQRPSRLSSTLYSGPRLGRLVQAFRQEADVTTLFLRSLLSLEIHTREATVPGLPVELSQGMHKIFDMHVSDACHDKVRRERSEFKEEVEALFLSTEILPRQPIYMFADTEIQVYDRFKGEALTSKRWLVGWLYSSSKVTPGFAQLCHDPDLAYSPWVGLAAPLQHDPEFKGHTFCFLPLPLLPENETGLPVHVNASFALGQDRQQLKRRSGDQAGEDEGALSWNQGLKTEVLGPLYVQLIRALVERGDASAVYGAIPDANKVVDEWKTLAKTLVKGLKDICWLHSDNKGGQWLKPKQAVVAQLTPGLPSDLEETVLEALVQVYLQLGQGVVRLPPHVQRVLHKAVASTHPGHVTAVLGQHGLPSPCPPSTRLLLLDYLLTCGQADLLTGLELLPTADGSFQTFQRGQGDVLACEQLEDLTSLLPGQERHLLVSGIRAPLRIRLLQLAASEFSS